MRKRIKSLQPGDKIMAFGLPEEILRVDHGCGYTAAFCEHNTYYYRDCDEQKRVKVLDEGDTEGATIIAWENSTPSSGPEAKPSNS